MKTLKQTGEFKFIKVVSSLCKNDKSVFKGIGDDTAVINSSRDKYSLFTTDTLLEDVHFKRTQIPQQIGHKAIACSISDIAAMGGIPEYALVSVGFPQDIGIKFAKKMYSGILKTAGCFGVSVVGGDTVCSKKIMLSIFVSGTVRRKNLVMRSGAKQGDAIFVTGKLGGSAKGRHLKFIPRVEESNWLVANFKINSMIDISDGLVQDLGHILEESKVGALVIEGNVPVSLQARNVEDAYYQGEDFELLFTVSARNAKRLKQKWPFKKTVKLTCIGKIKNKKFGLKVENKNGNIEELKQGGYQHFDYKNK
ncbi:MAG: thiamine-monophosphate kinase [PVC group bacterium]|nr:thiamine-monophosphate kinase [PVC group bacterium]